MTLKKAMRQMMKMNKIELLAPAKNLNYGIEAINCGADAVYIGGPKFGARVNAGNSLEDIKKLADYAHFYNAKVYVTLNTLLYDRELEEAKSLTEKIYAAGVDALIIQDPAFLEMDIPPLPLFASTQMHNATASKVQFLENVGFKRVILARELSLPQIKEIRSQTTVELECFIHGALCVSYSGQCYLSYALGKRSGNRGDCAQPCRNLYSLKTASGKEIIKNKHLLSLKDLNLAENLAGLIDAGVSSFKIEGRLKDLSYLKNVVLHYRQVLDGIMAQKNLKKSSSGSMICSFTPNLNKSFNRGYCDYFLNGRQRFIASWDTPKWTGEKAGEIQDLGRDYFILQEVSGAVNTLSPGDGISYFNRDGVLTGTVINKVEGKKVYPESMQGLSRQAFVYLNHDHNFIQKLKSFKPQRKIRVSFKFCHTARGYQLSVSDEDGNQACAVENIQYQAAVHPERMRETICRQLAKTGESQYEMEHCEIAKADGEIGFIPVSMINELRRKALDNLTQQRKLNYQRPTSLVLKNDTPYPETKLSFEGNVLNQMAEKFYLRHGVTEIEKAAESGLELKNRRVMVTKYCILFELGLCLKQHPQAEEYFLTDLSGNRFLLRFDCGRCQMEVWL